MMLHLAIFFGGLSALTWEILWMHFASLAIGVSAKAAAITLSAMMLGMMAGSLAAGKWLRRLIEPKYLLILAGIEALIGISGFFLPAGFQIIDALDVWIFQHNPEAAPIVQGLSIITVIGVPAFFMGASVPVFARIADRHQISLARLYAFNITGAAMGIVLASYVLVPLLGIKSTIFATAYLNVLAAVLAICVKLPPGRAPEKLEAKSGQISSPIPWFESCVIVFCTGLVTFALEVIWFRSFRAALQATTESFAMMLFGTLISLAVGGFISTRLRLKTCVSLPLLLALTGFFVLLITPVVQRFDLIIPQRDAYAIFMFKRLCFVLVVLGLPMGILGTMLPWVLELNKRGNIGRLYALNTLGAVMGSLGAAWLLLPLLGAEKGAWFVGLIPLLVAGALYEGKKKLIPLTLAVAGLAVAIAAFSGVGHLRVQGVAFIKDHKVLDSKEGPDSTVSAIEDPYGVRFIIIDGFFASGENKEAHYMEYMGRLPMILHPDPKVGLVICFGVGQTANAVRQEGVEHLDIVDVNKLVFELAPFFTKNLGVLTDPVTNPVVMDGRAFLKRTQRTYDVITLEPMAPTMSQTNALYSREFYELMNARLNDDGVVAQWLPFHIIDPVESAASVAAFMAVFSNSHLWIDPKSNQGILIGYKRGSSARGLTWYGLDRKITRGLTANEIKGALTFDESVLKKFISLSPKMVTDDNQLLSYGYGRLKWSMTGTYELRLKHINSILERIANGSAK